MSMEVAPLIRYLLTYIHIAYLLTYYCRRGGDVGREATDQVPATELRDGGCGRTTSAEPLRDYQGLLRTVADTDSRPRREEPGPSDQRLESIRE